jgi:hypothetical protein
MPARATGATGTNNCKAVNNMESTWSSVIKSTEDPNLGLSLSSLFPDFMAGMSFPLS